MAANGISTLPNKQDRKLAKIALATIKRQAHGTNGYRVLNYYVGTVSPTPGRPWSIFSPAPHGANLDDELGHDFITENNIELITE